MEESPMEESPTMVDTISAMPVVFQ